MMKFHSNTDGVRLLTFLNEKVEGSSRAIKRSIDRGGVFVNGKCERFSTRRLAVGDLIEYEVKQRVQGVLSVLFEDEDLIVYDKPAGHTCVDPNQVHRLDRMTTGVYLVSKNNFTKDSLEKQFYAKTVEKTYLALVCGRVKDDEGVIDAPLGKKGTYDGQTLWGIDPNGKRSLTHFRVLFRFEKMTLLACFPKTGRTHQLRVHLGSIGHPIVGDHQYCRERFPLKVDRMMLHAYRLEFTHPRTGERVIMGGTLGHAEELAQNFRVQQRTEMLRYFHGDVPGDFIDALSRG